MSSTRRRFALSAIAAAVIAAAGGLAALHVQADSKTHSAAAAPPPATSVDVAQVVNRQIVDWQAYSGRLEAVNRVEVRALVSGTLVAVNFKDGALVNKGDVLFTIDPRPYAVEADRARAQLAAAEARAGYTANELARGERLLANNAIARRDYEEKQNASREAAANLQGAQAAVAAAQLNLGYTRITAPVAGQVSRAGVTVGNVIAAGGASAPLTTLVSVSQLYASFDVDEQSFLKFINRSRTTSSSAVPVFLGLANEDGYPRQGQISSIDNRLDTSSGTIRVRAVFDNKDGVLLPGLYARIRLGGGVPRDALLIDEKAIGTDQDKNFVLTVDANNHAAYREIHTGPTFEGLRVVEGGLNPGERIVVNGIQRVRPGEAVTPQEVPMQQAKAQEGKAQEGKAQDGKTQQAKSHEATAQEAKTLSAPAVVAKKDL